ncbi:MAG: recombinase RecT [Oleispira sp.]|nr:recombinase RecT [Oleispira sp.]
MSNLAVIQKDLECSLIAAGVESVLPDSMKMSTFVKCAAVAMASSADLAEANQDSVIMALTQCAKDGLVPDNKEAAIITFNTKVKRQGKSDEWIKKAQYLPMIDGVMKRARMSGQIAVLSSKAVFKEDQFDYWMDENGEHINYRPTFAGGEMRLAFAFAKLTNGELIVEVMSRADIDKVRAASKTGTYGPWKDWYERMACKAVMHRLARRLPNASEIVEMCETGMNMEFDARTEKEIMPEVVNPIDKLKTLLADKNPEQYLPWLKVESLEDLSEANAAAAVLRIEGVK